VGSIVIDCRYQSIAIGDLASEQALARDQSVSEWASLVRATNDESLLAGYRWLISIESIDSRYRCLSIDYAWCMSSRVGTGVLRTSWGLFLEGPRKFSHPGSRGEMSSVMITKLFYSHICNINRGFLHTRSFRCIHLSIFRYRLTKNGFAGPKKFPGLSRNGPVYNGASLTPPYPAWDGIVSPQFPKKYLLANQKHFFT